MRGDVDATSNHVALSAEVREARQTSVASDFRRSMRNLASGVSVVTVGTGSEASGFTATSVTSLSVETPALLVSINRNSASWPLVQSSRRFAVNILSPAHIDIAETFAGRRSLKGNDRYIDPRWQQGTDRVPHLVDALAVIECDLEEALQRYSHAILIGRVVSVTSDDSRRPLAYWQGGYHELCEGPIGD